ncbi:hypothetical protein AKG11_23100 [Shinella sp. SUS2]|nr:hypothetical protein AKG11_23100 [Shinella sp. SUS2]KOC74380.1 hypothetical protein AKG10_17965 [Shinella sp. GWS1]
MVFGSLAILLDIKFETVDEAVGKEVPGKTGKNQWVPTTPRWGGERAWLILPYIDALDQKRLQEQFEIAMELAPLIREHIARRDLSPDFLDRWGRFRAACGLLEFLYHSETSVGHRRSARAGGQAKTQISEEHQRWFAHYFLRNYRRGKRPEAEQVVTKLINGIVDGNLDVGPHHDVKWFEHFLNIDDAQADNYLTLREAYKEDGLPVKRMKELVAQGADGLPSVTLEFPDP